MNVVVNDSETVPSSGSYGGKELMFSLYQSGPLNASIILENSGANQITYLFQEFNGTTWVDIGSDVALPATVPSRIAVLGLTSDYPQVRLLAVSSAGSTLKFNITRVVTRSAGGPINLI